MTISIQKTYAGMSSVAAELVAQQLRKKPDSVLCFPSGDTPTGLLKNLVEQSRTGAIDLSKCFFIGLDEWVGMNRYDNGSCQHYMYTQFFDPASIAPTQIAFFDAKASDLKKECQRIDETIFQRGGIDLIIVGVGMNGHIGLNEPGTPFDTYCHSRPLDESTKTVGQKYFTSATPLTNGITVGLKHMMEAKTIAVIASSEKKSRIIKQIAEGPVTEQVPGSILQRHHNAMLLLDEGAASQLAKIS